MAHPASTNSANPVHRADARLKFILTVALIFAIALQPTGAYVAILLAWLAIELVALLAGLGPLRTVRGAVFALPFVLAAFPLVFTRTADPLGTIELGPLTLTISGEGLRMFTTIALNSFCS